MPSPVDPPPAALLGDAERHRDGLLAIAVEALAAGDLVRALRHADRARRLTADDVTLAMLCARLSGRLGRPGAALEILADVSPRGHWADHGLLRAELLLNAGEPEEAAGALETLLAMFAVDALEGVAEIAAGVCRQRGHLYDGWVGLSAGGDLVGAGLGLAPFRVPRPGDPGALAAALAKRGRLIGAAGLRWPPAWRLDGRVRRRGAALSGEATLGWAPGRPVSVVISDGQGREVEAVTIPSAEGRQVFSALLPRGWGRRGVSVHAMLPDGRRVLLPGLANSRAEPARRAERPAAPTPRTCVIVPVYAGPLETLACLRSVLETTDPTAVELVAVWDCGPEPELLSALQDLASQGLVTLLLNDENRGFPASVNRGMDLRPEDDVVLLNADAEVFPGWLPRLAAAAYAHPDVATATPFANNGSIMAYPASDDLDCDSVRAREFDRLFAASAANPVDLPTGVGFCLYIKRAALAQVGPFEEQAFGPGYGEENDFCLRAAAAGWRHVAAVNLFVRHSGGRSFGPLKALLMENNLRTLESRQPGYARLVQRFVEKDPLHGVRREVDRRRLVADTRPTVLVITLGRDGGVRRHVAERKAALAAQGARVLELKPDAEALAEGVCRLEAVGEGLCDLAYELPREAATLDALLAALHILRVEIHHVLGLDPSVIDLPGRLGLPFEVFVHDYAWICPRITLSREDDAYCGEPEIAVCEQCVAERGALIEEDISVADLRARSERLFEAATSVTVPSADVARRLSRYFPRVSTRVSPWEDDVVAQPRADPPATGPVRIAVIGAIGPHKGYAALLACARDAATRSLPLEFVVIGYTEDDATLFETGRVFVTGRFAEAEVPELLAREGCQVAFYPYIVPETWSYALTHGLRSGLPIVAFDRGAVGERLRGVARARLVPAETDTAALNEALIAAAGLPPLVSLRARGGGADTLYGKGWARLPDDTWIESFRINRAGLRYRAILAGGDTTGWIAAPAWCGDPARPRPLMGFALSLATPRAGCRYAGLFSSGAVVTATEQGAVCLSPNANDPLIGLSVDLAAAPLDEAPQIA